MSKTHHKSFPQWLVSVSTQCLILYMPSRAFSRVVIPEVVFKVCDSSTTAHQLHTITQFEVGFWLFIKILYYISFLQLLPLSSAPGSSSFISQVANNLQTEFSMETWNIYHAWSLWTESLKAIHPKLMKWSWTVTYKELSVALPLSTWPEKSQRLLL